MDEMLRLAVVDDIMIVQSLVVVVADILLVELDEVVFEMEVLALQTLGEPEELGELAQRMYEAEEVVVELDITK